MAFLGEREEIDGGTDNSRAVLAGGQPTAVESDDFAPTAVGADDFSAELADADTSTDLFGGLVFAPYVDSPDSDPAAVREHLTAEAVPAAVQASVPVTPTPPVATATRAAGPRWRKPVLIGIAAAVCALTITGGTLAAMTKTVTISVDGQDRQVTTLSGSVDGVLSAAGVSVGTHDALAPVGSSSIADGSKISITRGRQFDLAIDGKAQKMWTTVGNVSAAMALMHMNPADYQLSVDPATAIPASGLSVTGSRRRVLTVTIDGVQHKVDMTAGSIADGLRKLGLDPADYKLSANGSSAVPVNGFSLSGATLHAVQVVGNKKVSVKSAATTVGGVLSEQGIQLGKNDRVSPSLATPVTGDVQIKIWTLPTIVITDGAHQASSTVSALKTVGDLLKAKGIKIGQDDIVSPSLSTSLQQGLKITVTRVAYKVVVEKKAIAQPADQSVEDSSMDKGTTEVTQDGHPGEQDLTYKVKVINGQDQKGQLIGTKTAVDAVATVTHVGTYVPPPPPPKPTTSSSSSSPSTSSTSSPSGSTSGSSAKSTGAGARAPIRRRITAILRTGASTGTRLPTASRPTTGRSTRATGTTAGSSSTVGRGSPTAVGSMPREPIWPPNPSRLPLPRRSTPLVVSSRGPADTRQAERSIDE